MQGPAEAENIRAIYASFASANTETVGELLCEIAQSKEVEEVTLVVCR